MDLRCPFRGHRAGRRQPCATGVMTASAIFLGVLPIMWSHGTGADVMKRIAAPMAGEMITTTILTLLVIPVIYSLWQGWQAGDHDSERG